MKTNKPKHTPGPWAALKYPDVKTFTVAAKESVASKIKLSADAYLIAAAPEMFEALERLVERVAQLNPDAKAACLKQLDEAKAATAKARGES